MWQDKMDTVTIFYFVGIMVLLLIVTFFGLKFEASSERRKVTASSRNDSTLTSPGRPR